MGKPVDENRRSRVARAMHSMRLRGTPWLLCLIALPASAAAWEFDFTAGGNAHGQPTYDPARGSGFEPGSAARFSVHVPEEGNYRVTVRLGGRDPGATTLLAEQRRLLLEDVRTARRQ